MPEWICVSCRIGIRSSGAQVSYWRINMHHVGFASAVVPQVEDQSVRVGEQCHGRNDTIAALPRVRKPVEFQVPDIPAPVLDLLECNFLCKDDTDRIFAD
jgi:hypothetical protein